MIQITGEMISVFLKNYASGGKDSDSCTRAGLEAVAPLIAAAYQEPAFGTVDNQVQALQDATPTGPSDVDLRIVAMNNVTLLVASGKMQSNPGIIIDRAESLAGWLRTGERPWS